ncbi:MAG TPA: hypothetical protein VL334_19120 [Anaerolineae bacterium]|nr:hypothetical protein [Anaerolineae bacterium]
MKRKRIVLITSQMTALCLACAVLLSIGQAYAGPMDAPASRQPANGLSNALPAIPVLGGCGGSIGYDQPVSGVIEPGNELCFEFTGAAGDVITASMTRLDGDLDPLLKLWGVDSVLALDDDGGGDRNSLIASFTLPESGSYALLASGYDASSSGSFELLLARAAAQPTPLPTPAAAAPCGGAIAYGEAVEEYLALGDRCEYSFVGEEGDLVTIGLESLDGQLDPWLDLIDPEGNVEVFDDDGGGDHNSLIRRHALLRSGTYTIVARAYQDSSAGLYRLALVQDLGLIPWALLLAPPPPSCGAAIEYGRQYEDSISSDALSCTYTFDGSRQNLVTLRMDATSGNLDPVVELYAPSDSLQPVISNDDAYDRNSVIWRFRLTEDGQYRVIAHAYQDQSAGNFQLLLTQGLFRRGDQVEIIYPEAVNIRRSPGHVNKPAGDVLAAVASGTVMKVVGGPRMINGLRWWQLEYRNSTGRVITGWMTEVRTTGEVILAPAFQP